MTNQEHLEYMRAKASEVAAMLESAKGMHRELEGLVGAVTRLKKPEPPSPMEIQQRSREARSRAIGWAGTTFAILFLALDLAMFAIGIINGSAWMIIASALIAGTFLAAIALIKG